MNAMFCLMFLVVCANGQTQNVRDVLNGISTVSNFNALVKSTGLDTTLAGSGPFTVFAPTGTAMARNGKLSTLTNNSQAATQFVRYHVASGSFNRQDLTINEYHLTSLSSQLIRVNHYNYRDRVVVQGSLVVESHAATNGYVHVINYYMDPPNGNLQQALASDPNLSTFYGLMQTAGLNSVLTDDGPYTVLAPNNAALAGLRSGVLNRLRNNTRILTDTLRYHIIHGTLYAFGMHSGYLHNLEEADRELVINSIVRGLTIDGNHIVSFDINASNGVIHHMDGLMVPRAYRSYVLYGLPLPVTTPSSG